MKHKITCDVIKNNSTTLETTISKSYSRYKDVSLHVHKTNTHIKKIEWYWHEPLCKNEHDMFLQELKLETNTNMSV